MARGTSRKKLVDAAIKLMLARGYSATRVEEICRAAAVSKGSLYHFFPTKEDLALAALDQFLLRGRRILFAGAYQTEKDPVKRMFGFVDHVRDHAGVLWQDGCLLGNFITDLASTDSEVRVHVAERFSQVARSFAPLLTPASGRRGAPSDVELAEQFLGVIEGGIILARAHKEPLRVAEAIEGFRNYVRLLVEA